MTRATKEQLVSASRTLALEASVNAGRITPALLALEEAAGPLSGAGSGGGSGGSDTPDPTFARVGKIDEAAADRRRVERIVLQQLALSKELTGLLAAWAPDEAAQAKARGVAMSNEDIWCPNHARHGMRETRLPEHKLCDFCDEFKREHSGLLPNRWLLDVRSRRRINSADVAKALADIQTEKDARKRAKAQGA
jgi:hypothetical protein